MSLFIIRIKTFFKSMIETIKLKLSFIRGKELKLIEKKIQALEWILINKDRFKSIVGENEFDIRINFVNSKLKHYRELLKVLKKEQDI